jgi:hypothetical protein
MSEAAFSWCQDQFISVAADESVRFLFLFTEPRPDYADELMSALRSKIGRIHKSIFDESVAVSVVNRVEEAHAIVTFWKEGWGCAGAEERLAYVTVLRGYGVGSMGSFCVTDHAYVGLEKHRDL